MEALALDPTHPTAMFLAGLASVALGDRAQAAEFSQRLLALAPNRAASHELAAYVRWDEAPREAEAFARTAIQLEPDHAPRYATRALLLSSTGRLEEAITVAHRGLTLDPDCIECVSALAKLYTLNEEPTLAEAMSTRALALDPDGAEPHLQMGFLLLGRGDTGGARQRFRESLRIAPTDPSMGDIAHERARTLRFFRDIPMLPTRPALVGVAVATPLVWYAMSLLIPPLRWVALGAAVLLVAGYLHVGAFFLVRAYFRRQIRRGKL